MTGTLTFAFLDAFNLLIAEGTMFCVSLYLIEIVRVNDDLCTVNYAAYERS